MKIGTILYQGSTAQVIVTSFCTCIVKHAAPGGYPHIVDTFYDTDDAIACCQTIDAGTPWVQTWTDEKTKDFESFYRMNCD